MPSTLVIQAAYGRFCGISGEWVDCHRMVAGARLEKVGRAMVGHRTRCLPEQVLGRGAQVDQDPLNPPLGHGFRASEHGSVDQVEPQVGNVPHGREPRQRG
jgi:hypothetical protein